MKDKGRDGSDKNEKEDVTISRRKLSKKRLLSFELESSRSHCVEEPFWKRLLTGRQTKY
jgi:hypothetical protein